MAGQRKPGLKSVTQFTVIFGRIVKRVIATTEHNALPVMHKQCMLQNGLRRWDKSGGTLQPQKVRTSLCDMKP